MVWIPAPTAVGRLWGFFHRTRTAWDHPGLWWAVGADFDEGHAQAVFAERALVDALRAGRVAAQVQDLASGQQHELSEGRHRAGQLELHPASGFVYDSGNMFDHPALPPDWTPQGLRKYLTDVPGLWSELDWLDWCTFDDYPKPGYRVYALRVAELDVGRLLGDPDVHARADRIGIGPSRRLDFTEAVRQVLRAEGDMDTTSVCERIVKWFPNYARPSEAKGSKDGMDDVLLYRGDPDGQWKPKGRRSAEDSLSTARKEIDFN